MSFVKKIATDLSSSLNLLGQQEVSPTLSMLIPGTPLVSLKLLIMLYLCLLKIERFDNVIFMNMSSLILYKHGQASILNDSWKISTLENNHKQRHNSMRICCGKNMRRQGEGC